MPKKSDICTNYFLEEDRDILTRPLFAVNMRLFNSSPGYRKLVLGACKYLLECCTHQQDGVPSYDGFSGANGGVPWDIIVLDCKGEKLVAINATLQLGESSFLSYESCGSLPNAGVFTVSRADKVIVNYYDTDGSVRSRGLVARPAAVIQHEVDHNDGILLLDRVKKVGE